MARAVARAMARAVARSVARSVAKLQTQVEKERDRALESLVQTLFGTVNTPVVAVTLRMIVKQAGEKAPPRQRGNPQVYQRPVHRLALDHD